MWSKGTKKEKGGRGERPDCGRTRFSPLSQRFEGKMDTSQSKRARAMEKEKRGKNIALSTTPK